jgi:hypothetical protein
MAGAYAPKIKIAFPSQMVILKFEHDFFSYIFLDLQNDFHQVFESVGSCPRSKKFWLI